MVGIALVVVASAGAVWASARRSRLPAAEPLA